MLDSQPKGNRRRVQGWPSAFIVAATEGLVPQPVALLVNPHDPKVRPTETRAGLASLWEWERSGLAAEQPATIGHRFGAGEDIVAGAAVRLVPKALTLAVDLDDPDVSDAAADGLGSDAVGRAIGPACNQETAVGGLDEVRGICPSGTAHRTWTERRLPDDGQGAVSLSRARHCRQRHATDY